MVRGGWFQKEKGESRAVDDYDRSVRELQFERRGLALDRLKTEEELAMQEKERLEKLEVCGGGWSVRCGTC